MINSNRALLPTRKWVIYCYNVDIKTKKDNKFITEMRFGYSSFRRPQCYRHHIMISVKDMIGNGVLYERNFL